MSKRLAVVLNQAGQPSEVFLLQLFQRLQKNAEIKVYSFKKPILSVHDLKDLKIKWIPRPFSFHFISYLILHPGQLLKGSSRKQAYYSFVLNFIKEKDIYFPFLGMTRAFAGVMNENCSKIIYTSIRGTDITVTPLYNFSVIEKYKQYAPHIYKMHYLSEELREQTASFGLKYEREHVIFQGVDLKIFKPTPLPSQNGKLKLLTVGRLHYIKGLEMAVFAALTLKNRGLDFQLDIVGDGPEYEKIDFLIKNLGLSKCVILHGSKNRSEILEFYRYTHLYLHTHLVNGLSNTMLEALACNRRVITFESNLVSYGMPELSELITEIPKFDYMLMADAIGKLWNLHELSPPVLPLNKVLYAFSLEKQTIEFMDFFELT